MALDGRGQLCKWILILFNILFALVGFAMLALGLWLRFSGVTKSIFEMENDSQSAFVIAVIMLILLGTMMLVVVSFGDYGVCCKSRCSLQVFSALLAVMAGAEIGAGVIAYMRRNAVASGLAEFYNRLYVAYIDGSDASDITLRFFHTMFECCGLLGTTVFDLAKDTCPKQDGFLAKFTIPACPPVILEAFEERAPLVLGTFVGTAALLITALVCTSILMKKMKRNQYGGPVHFSNVQY
ncbi:CD9 antigen isoform X2 [Lampris incognitus]|uniref:CD9 antigen isoform X2 n=1 Tax=Lampris incognitus TaxID=2546036 RepID=UPI0024B4D2E3|nr:CD9 antigen isoform X2 [Lampris incognitus]